MKSNFKKIIYTLIVILGFVNVSLAQQYTVTSGADKYILLEAAVGSNNGFTPDAYCRQDVLRNSNPKLIIVNNHNNNFGLSPLKFSTSDQWNSSFITGYPMGTIDRVPYGSSVGISRGSWTNAINAINTTPKYQVSITVKKIGPQLLKILVVGKALVNLTGEYRFNVIITEDSLIQNQSGSSSCYSSSMTTFPHKDVLRAYLGSEWGIYKCNNPTINQIDTMAFLYIIPNSTNVKNLKLIGMVQKYSLDSTLREVMNAIATPLLDTLTSGLNSSSGLINNTLPGNFKYDKIGETFSNNQSNASMYRRLQLMPNNKIGATWTTSSDASPFIGRGSGYNLYNGTTWEKGDTSITRIENQRTGFPSYAYNPTNNEEVMLSHIVTTSALSGGMVLSRRTAGTNNAWTQTTVLDTISSVPGVLWCKTAISNNYLHVVACYTDSSQNQPNRVVRNGVRTPVVYSRYNFTTNAWDIKTIALPGYNNTRYYNGSSDSYSIDASSNNVAVLIGGITKDLSLWKSTNNGISWTKTVVDSFKYSPYGSSQVLMTDTPYTNDGAVHVLLDNTGKTHCFWSLSRVYDDDINSPGYYYYRLLSLIYWNDARTYANKSLIGTWEDTDNNWTYNLGSNWNSINTRYINTSVITMPSAGISSDGKIFCTYSALTEWDESMNGENYRDVHLTYSSDGGNTWSDPRNITSHLGINKEQAFPSIARTVNNKIHLTFTESIEPGPNTAGKWDVKYLGIDTSVITQNQSFFTSINSSSSYAIEDTILCRGESLNYYLSNAQLWIGSVLVKSAIGTQGWYSIPFDSTKIITIKDSLGVIFKSINIQVGDTIIMQKTTLSNALNICGLSTKFAIGGNTSYSGSKSFNWYRNDTLLSSTIAIDSFVIAGNYKLRATTSIGCKSELFFTINKFNNVFNPNFSSNRQVVTAPPFDFTFANQTQPLNDYNYFWKWGDGITDSTNNQILFKTYSNNGQYTVKLIAQHKITGCKDSITKVNFISCSGFNPQPLAATTTKQNPFCAGEATGSITVNGTGGTTPYTYRINGGTYQSSNAFTNLVAGIYTMDIKDAANNVVTKKDTLVNPPVVTVGAISGPNNVPVSSLQSYSIATQSGASYLWSVLNGTLLSGNGTTTIQVQWPAGSGIGKIIASVNKGNCGATDTLTVAISPQPLGITSTKQNPFCAGEATGSITVNGSGGTAPYLYRMNGGTYQTNNTFNNLAAGVYDVEVKDAINNTVTKKDTLTNPPAITVGGINGLNGVPVNSIQSYSISAQSGANYFWNVINGTLLSGNGTTAIQVQWPAVGGIGRIVAAVSKGNCGAVDTLTVAIGGTPLSLTTNKTNEACTGSANGSITVSAAGGNPPYTYAINNASYQSSNTFSNLIAGIYLVKVKDNSQLVAQRYDTITAGARPTVGIITGPITAATLSLQNYIVGQQANVSYIWSATGGVVASGQNTNIAQIAWGAQPILAKVNVKITTNSGCADSASLDVNVGSVGLNDVLLHQYTLSPNPTQHTLTITSKNSSTIQGNIIITDMLGRKVKEVIVNNASSDVLIDVSELVNGIYTLSVEDKNTISHTNFIKK